TTRGPTAGSTRSGGPGEDRRPGPGTEGWRRRRARPQPDPPLQRTVEAHGTIRRRRPRGRRGARRARRARGTLVPAVRVGRTLGGRTVPRVPDAAAAGRTGRPRQACRARP